MPIPGRTHVVSFVMNSVIGFRMQTLGEWILILLLLAGFIVLTEGSAVLPFIYAVF